MSGERIARRTRALRPGTARGLVRGSLAVWFGAWLLAPLAGCAAPSLDPVAIDTKNDTCAWCRMAISNTRFAAELLTPAEEPRLFDDIGCLRDYLAASASALSPGAAAFVADHRTGAWVAAHRAVYRQGAGSTPMASGLAAWADEVSCRNDREAAGWTPRSASEVFGPTGLPGGSR